MALLKNTKIPFLAKHVWKKIFLIKTTTRFRSSFYYVSSRSSVIPLFLTNRSFYIYRGNRWRRKLFQPWSVGYKYGEFTWNKKPALYKAKKLRKKKKK